MRRAPWTDAELARALDGLRHVEMEIEAPPHIEAAVLAKWDEAHGPTSAYRRALWRQAAAVAAGITIGIGLWQLGHHLQLATRLPSSDDQSRTLVVVGEPILQGEPVRMVRMRMPASTLAGLGVRTVAVDPASQVDVDVIVGEDGIARAIRVGM